MVTPSLISAVYYKHFKVLITTTLFQTKQTHTLHCPSSKWRSEKCKHCAFQSLAPITPGRKHRKMLQIPQSSASSGWVGRTNRLHAWLPPCFLCVTMCEVHPELLWGLRVLRTWVVGFACEGPLPSLIAIRLSDGLSTQTTTLYHFCWPILVQANANTWSALALHWICFWRIYKKIKCSCVFWCSLTEAVHSNPDSQC